MKNNLVALSIFCFAVCFVIGSWLISNSLGNNSTQQINQTEEKQLLTQSEVANYLGITTEEVQKLTKISSGPNAYTTEIPHIEIENIVYYPKKAIDEWLQNMIMIVVP